MSALVLCLWTTSFTLIANFAPSGATGNRYYCEVNSAALLQAAVEEVNNLTTNTSRENAAVIKLIDDIEFAGTLVFNLNGIFNSFGEKELEGLRNNPRPVAFVTLDLNGHVLTLESEAMFGSVQYAGWEIIDSNPNAANTLPDDTTVTGGAVYGDGAVIMSYGFLTINGGNFCGDMGILTAEGDLTINQGTISCYSSGFGFIETLKTVNGSIILVSLDAEQDVTPDVNINGGQIAHPITFLAQVDDGFVIVTNQDVIDQYVTIGENVNVITDDAGNIIRYEEIKAEPEPTEPTEPTDPTEQEPNDNKTPVLSGTTNNGQPTSDDFMKIMMIGVLVIVALSVVSIAASLLIIKKYRPRVA